VDETAAVLLETHAPAFAPILGKAQRIRFESFQEAANFHADLPVIRRSILSPANWTVSGFHNYASANTRAGRAAAMAAALAPRNLTASAHLIVRGNDST